jgi:endonuclease/exonuclease/phosphatase family metal-dependent hydrolase
MRIMSLNAWGGAVFDTLAAWLPTTGADVLCLQEVTRTPGAEGWTQFSDDERTLPQRANLFDDVGTLLPAHAGVFLASDAGPVIDRHGVRHRQEFGIAAFVNQRITILTQDSVFVHGDFVDHDEWHSANRPRVAHAMRLLDHAQDRVVTVVHLHGVRDPAGKADTPARLHQAERLAELVTRTRREGDLCVVCGDLNLMPGSQTFATLRQLGLIDLVGNADTRSSLYRKPIRHASYMLVSDPGSVRDFSIPPAPEVSDHRPLVLDLLTSCRPA